MYISYLLYHLLLLNTRSSAELFKQRINQNRKNVEDDVFVNKLLDSNNKLRSKRQVDDPQDNIMSSVEILKEINVKNGQSHVVNESDTNLTNTNVSLKENRKITKIGIGTSEIKDGNLKRKSKENSAHNVGTNKNGNSIGKQKTIESDTITNTTNVDNSMLNTRLLGENDMNRTAIVGTVGKKTPDIQPLEVNLRISSENNGYLSSNYHMVDQVSIIRPSKLEYNEIKTSDTDNVIPERSENFLDIRSRRSFGVGRNTNNGLLKSHATGSDIFMIINSGSIQSIQINRPDTDNNINVNRSILEKGENKFDNSIPQNFVMDVVINSTMNTVSNITSVKNQEKFAPKNLFLIFNSGDIRDIKTNVANPDAQLSHNRT